MKTCAYCSKLFTHSNSLNRHYREKHNHSAFKSADLKAEKIVLYYKNPKRCLQCNDVIEYDKRSLKFCNKSCAASYNNATRPSRSFQSRQKTSLSLKMIKQHTKKFNFKEHVVGDYSPIFLCKCMHCDIEFVNRSRKKYCANHCDLYKNNNRNRYAFTFNVFDYPDIFDLDKLRQKGFYGAGGKASWNPDGFTRDHKISVNDAIRNGYDPFYIKHPLNCELMSFRDNNKKKTRSSLRYEDLVFLVDQYIWLSRKDSNFQQTA